MKEITVLAFGRFDGFHIGHLNYLKKAKKLGTKLIVSIARDSTIWQGSRHSKIPEIERKELIEELGLADKVVFGSKTDAFEGIKRIKPDILAVTNYDIFSVEQIRQAIKNLDLKTKVVQIKSYKPRIFNKIYEKN